MKLLLVAATEAEISGLRASNGDLPVGEVLHGALTVDADLLLTGVGMIATAYYLGRVLVGYQPSLVLNVGIAGTFRREWPLGKVVEICEEQFADLGVDDKGVFRDLFEVQLLKADEDPYDGKSILPVKGARLLNDPNLERARGITVNTVHGSEAAIAAVLARFQPDVESMEGAAIFFACRMAGVPVLQWRALSNYVEPRNRAAWKIPEALEALWSTLVAVLPSANV